MSKTFHRHSSLSFHLPLGFYVQQARIFFLYELWLFCSLGRLITCYTNLAWWSGVKCHRTWLPNPKYTIRSWILCKRDQLIFQFDMPKFYFNTKQFYYIKVSSFIRFEPTIVDQLNRLNANLLIIFLEVPELRPGRSHVFGCRSGDST